MALRERLYWNKQERFREIYKRSRLDMWLSRSTDLYPECTKYFEKAMERHNNYFYSKEFARIGLGHTVMLLLY